MGFNKSKENLTERNSNNSSNLLKELMEAEMLSRDKISNIDVFKDIVAGLEEKVQILMDDINFLRRDAESKNNIINQLTQIIKNRIDIPVQTNETSESDSATNVNIGNSNSDVSNYNQRNGDSIVLNTDAKSNSTRLTSDGNVTEIKLGDYDGTCDGNGSINTGQMLNESFTVQIENYKKVQKDIYNLRKTAGKLNVTENEDTSVVMCSTPAGGSKFETFSTSSSDNITSTNTKYKFADQFTWEKHSNGIASQIIDKMGYRGEGFGLGKFEDGIGEAIKVDGQSRFKKAEKYENVDAKRERICILSGSMLNRLNEKRLSNENFEVKIRCHGGCTLKCLYTHLSWAFNLLPQHIIIHVGTNDCTKKISDEVLKELFDLKVFILKVLPSCKVWLSLPLMRTDNKVANSVIRNLNTKVKRQCDMVLDHSNINERHLSRGGLHLNEHGTKLMAKNIISHIRRL